MLQIQPHNLNTVCPKEHKNNNLYAANFYAPMRLNKDTVSFSGKNKDLLELSEKEIFDKISESINNANFLGGGNEARVYRIPDTNYVFRSARIPDNRMHSGDYTKMLSFDLTTDDRINHIVAKLGEGCSIMKYLPGKNCFAYKNKKELFNLPLESYYNLYKQICYAKDNDMIFDCCETNIIYNPKDKSLTAIDFYKQDYDFPENVKPLSYIYSAIASSIATTDKTLYKNLLGSLVGVILKEFEPGVKPTQNIGEFDINRFFGNFENYYEDDMPPQYKILKSKLIDLQCLKLQEILGHDVKNEQIAAIKISKSIVNQILKKDNNSFLNNLKLWNYEF